MGWLFILALVFVIPSFGLSLVAWFALAWFNARQKVAGIHRREEMKTVVEPLFGGQFAEFFLALDVPTMFEEFTPEEARQCGRHIMNYVAHNPSETAMFMKGLERHRTRTGDKALDPVGAARDEYHRNAKAEIHLTSYRAIIAITTNNSSVGPFRKAHLAAVAMNVNALESLELIRANQTDTYTAQRVTHRPVVREQKSDTPNVPIKIPGNCFYCKRNHCSNPELHKRLGAHSG